MAPSSSKESEPSKNAANQTNSRMTTKKLPVPEGFKACPPEGGFGWVVMAGILLVTIMMSVPATTLGIMLQEIIVTMDSSTSATSLAGSISMSSSNFISPLVTVAIHAFSCRTTTIFGGVTLSLGLILSYFTTTIGPFIAVYGLFTGIGYGFARISVLVLASHYFHDRYGIAASIIYTGFSLGRFIFSPFVAIVNEKYGLRGTFLFMGGITLNICVGAVFFQPARWHYVLRPIVNINDPVTIENAISQKTIEEQEIETIKRDRLHSVIESDDVGHVDIGYNDIDNNGTINDGTVQLTYYRKLSHGATKSETTDLLSESDEKNVEGEVILVERPTTPKKKKSASNWSNKLVGYLDFTLLTEPVFYVILASQVLTYLSLMYGLMFFPTLCLDKGLTPMESAILPTFRAAAEIGGRIAIPLLQAVSHLDPVVFYILTCIAAGTAFLAQALVEGYYLILLTALATGFLTGGTVVQNTTITLISVGQKKLPSTLGLCAFFQGFFILVGGPLIGRVRDVTGSLVYGFLLITAFQFACAFVWIFRYLSLRNTKRSIEKADEVA